MYSSCICIWRKYANTSVRELIRIEDTLNASHTDVLMTQGMNSGILNIRIYATDQEQCERIAEIIKTVCRFIRNSYSRLLDSLL